VSFDQETRFQSALGDVASNVASITCQALTHDVADAAAEAASGEAGLDHGDIPWLRTHPGL
jgi:hypothetical protein